MSQLIRFHYRGAVHTVADASPTRTVLQHLREDLHCTGTKEGCAEGDCGACVVVIGTLQDGKVELKAVNSCIQLLPTLDGKALFSVEDLQQADGALHPVQQAMVECHGSQCGFCTPGFVVGVRAFLNSKPKATEEEIRKGLNGNLCRCGTYPHVFEAVERAAGIRRAEGGRQETDAEGANASVRLAGDPRVDAAVADALEEA